MNKVKSWEPKHVDRPLSANRTSNWEWTAPYNGTLYLVVTTQERAYVTITYNRSTPIATVAMPTTNPSAVTTIPIKVKKGDIINVNQLTTKCWLSTETSFIRGGYNPCNSNAFSTFRKVVEA